MGLGAEEKNFVGLSFKAGVKVRQELSRDMEGKGIPDEAKAPGKGAEAGMDLCGRSRVGVWVQMPGGNWLTGRWVFMARGG